MAEFQINGINIRSLATIVDKSSTYPKSPVGDYLPGVLNTNESFVKPDPN